MLVLSQFVLRLSFGLAFAMAITSPKQVTSGYFRNHAYVLLGLNALATLAALADRAELLLWPPLTAALLSYGCAAVWLYEKPHLGKALLWGAAIVAFLGALPAQTNITTAMTEQSTLLWNFNTFTAGLLLGSTIAAMFLGHWYLNTPTMELAPLRRLLLLIAVAIAARAVVCAVGLVFQIEQTGMNTTQWLLVGLRWIAGIVGTAALTSMSWQTLKIPNTQSATGILYVAVLATFLGELTSLLLSSGGGFAL
jgi:hypothetical protein